MLRRGAPLSLEPTGPRLPAYTFIIGMKNNSATTQDQQLLRCEALKKPGKHATVFHEIVCSTMISEGFDGMRVLILSCNTGEGHNSCSAAIQECFEAQGVHCEVTDALRFISKGAS